MDFLESTVPVLATESDCAKRSRFATERIPFGTSIANIYLRHVVDYAQTASLVHELSGGRFAFGVGVSHGPALDRMGVKAGPPLGDMRAFVAGLRAAPRAGELPPIVLATLRVKMIALAGEIADGMVFANAARSHMHESLAALPAAKANDPNFFIGDMIPTCISDDEAAAAAVNRKTLIGYVAMPNYRNYWREAGYVDEMNAIEKALEGEELRRGAAAHDRPLALRRHLVRLGESRPRRAGGMVRRRGADADPGAVVGGGKSDQGVRRAVCLL